MGQRCNHKDDVAHQSGESLSNVGFICPSCADARKGKFSDQKPESFVGRYVKVAFPATHPLSGRDTKEHMWVKVTHVSEDDLKTLIGWLDNDPVYLTKVQCGDEVSVTVEEIEEVA